MRTFIINALAVVVCVCLTISFSKSSHAQVQTLSNNRTGNTGTNFGNSNLGNLGNNALGGSQFGLSSLGTVQNLTPQNDFIGRSDASQNSFIGRTNAQNTANNANANRNFNRANSSGLQNRQNQLNSGQNIPSVPAFRPQLRVAFKTPPLPLNNVKTSMGQSFDRIKEQNEQLRNVQFTLNADRSVTLHGQVESASAKKLVGFLAMLEPGVRKVKNELTVIKK